MNRRFTRILITLTAFVTGLLICGGVWAQGDVNKDTDYRKLKPPGSYGTVIMNSYSKESSAVNPVVFPHWAHRGKYTCKACHTDLGFKLKANTTGVTQADIEGGKYCAACHNGTVSFGANECNRCHSYGIQVKENSKIEDSLKGLPTDHFGNKVNWVSAANDKKITPGAAPGGKNDLTSLDLDIIIPVTKFTPHPPDVKFPHKPHTEQLDCATCHPSIFKQQKGGNTDMSMMKIISGQYCGTCHTKVAFPLDDCFRCHSQPPPKIEEPKADEKAAEKK
ncbi:MAG: hypothetical protein HY954_02895 [Deltaproteobacteria bacterium]|nr:hypothetical protein [Deltaproteobacteria bacterium]